MTQADRRDRDFDIVVFGATGFTGQLVAEYLLDNGGSDLRWALGARSESRLRDVRDRLAERFPAAADLELVIADSHDRTSLDAMTSRTAVVASTVGPYDVHGRELVAACVENGTDYCDITGEPQFVRAMIDTHHDEAERRGVRIVHCCGFDSIPSDLGSFLVQEAHRERYGKPATNLRGDVVRLRGKPSGGTVASVANLVDAVKEDPGLRKVLASPYSLNPPDRREGPRRQGQLGIGRGPYGWTAPFIMATMNEKVVFRSHALRFPQSSDFDYVEVSSFGEGPAGLARAAASLGTFAGLGLGLGVKPIRRVLLGNALPNPGEGPSREEIEAGAFEIRITATTPDGALVCAVAGDLDPGYGETSKMLGESALVLALDSPAETFGGGVLTPSTAMGGALVERLRSANMRLDVTAKT